MMLDWLRGLGTVSAFIAFCAICAWAYSGRRKTDFEQAAQLPFVDDEEDTLP
jgi:cytochrome c oxidase cbb3-type subunit 4